MDSKIEFSRFTSWTEDVIVLRPPFENVGGHCWRTHLPAHVTLRGDDARKPYRSRVVVLENGTPTGDSHAVHQRIERLGGGLHSFWVDTLYFSTTDNSDPNLNGRIYGIALTPFDTDKSVMRILTLGSCRVHIPISDLHNRGLAHSVFSEIPSDTLSLNFAEHMQFLEFCRGSIKIPKGLRRHIIDNDDFMPAGESAEIVGSADFSLVEICTQFEFTFEQYQLNRNTILKTIVEPARRFGPEAYRAAQSWYWDGFARGDENVRKASAAQLLRFLPDGSEDADLDRAIVRDARATLLDEKALRGRIEDFVRNLAGPFGVVTHIARYLSDGRPISWPPEFLSLINDVCRDMDIPIFNPCRLIMRDGVEETLIEDMTEYRPEFNRVLADHFLGFAERIKWRQEAPKAKGSRFPIPLATY